MRHLPQKEYLAFLSFAKREFGIDLIRGSTGHAVRRSPGAGFYCTHTNEFSDRVSAVTGYCQNNSFETEGYEKPFLGGLTAWKIPRVACRWTLF
jgi:hypothetical protein